MRIASDQVGKFWISTIYTSQTWNGEPRYETAVFDESKITHLTHEDKVLVSAAKVVEEFDYETEEEALANHRALVGKYSLPSNVPPQPDPVVDQPNDQDQE
jgi:hypothetical protein